MSADEGVLPERWPECEGPACGYRHDPNLPCFTDATDHDSVPGSTDTAGDPNRWTAEVVKWNDRMGVATVALTCNGDERRVTWMVPYAEAESLAAQINRPAPDPEGDKYRLALEAIDALRPEDFRTGQGHLPAAFREVNFKDAFREICRIVNGTLHGTDENGAPL